MDMAAIVEHAIFEAQRHFGHLHRHGAPADDEHPQDRARAAHGQRHRDAGDVAKADRARQGGRERGPLADIPLRLAFMRLGPQDADGAPALRHIGKAQPQGEEQHRQRQVEHDQFDLRAKERHLDKDGVGQAVDEGVEIFHRARMPPDGWIVDQRLLWAGKDRLWSAKLIRPQAARDM